MEIATRTIPYTHDGVTFEAFAAWHQGASADTPIVLVVGTFMGRTGFEESKARALAELGYVGVAIDFYGIANNPADFDGALAAMMALDADRPLLGQRLQAGVAAAWTLHVGDGAKMAAIGFCFGGKCVLDLARAGADLRGVASFHGVYDAPPTARTQTIAAKILVLHGWDDPLAPPESILALTKELTEAGADWQFHAYGHVAHGFTDPARPDMYDPAATDRSWLAMRNFLAEIF